MHNHQESLCRAVGNDAQNVHKRIAEGAQKRLAKETKGAKCQQTPPKQSFCVLVGSFKIMSTPVHGQLQPSKNKLIKEHFATYKLVQFK